MRILFAIVLVAALTAFEVSPLQAGARERRGVKRPQPTVSTDHIIKDLTIPWPFRQHWIFNDVAGDSDGDGVRDEADRCPNTPDGAEVDEHGCPIDMTETETTFLDTGVIRASNVLFESERADLKPESYAVLDEIGAILAQWPTLEIEIGGHTDSQGSERFNQELSERRAAAVRDYLVKKYRDIEAENLSVRGYGESKPVASNDTETGRAKNRRVEFTVLNKETLKKEIQRKGLQR